MGKVTFKNIIAVGTTALPTLLAWTSAGAQSLSHDQAMPVDTFTKSPGGVDLRTGQYIVNKTELVIGDPARGGLEFKRTTNNGYFTTADRMAQYSHNWMIFVTQSAGANDAGNKTVSITSEGLSETFLADINKPYPQASWGIAQISSGTYTAMQTSVKTGTTYYYTATLSGGEQIKFRNMGGNEASVVRHQSAFASELRYPNGIVYTLNYDATPKLKSVVSNAGYALVFEYVTSGSTTYISKVCGLNLTQQILPTNGLCPTGVPTVTYGYSGTRMTSATDASGNTSTMSYAPLSGTFSSTEKLFRPGESSPYLTNYYGGDSSTTPNPYGIVVEQTFADGHDYAYSWSGDSFGAPDDFPVSVIYSSGWVENGTLSTTVTYNTYHYSPGAKEDAIVSKGPEQIIDPLGRITNISYCTSCGIQQLYSKQLPGGLKLSNGYDSYFNNTVRVLTPNTGSSLSPITTSSSFDCISLTICNKPTYTIDAKGNRTDYTYDVTHGGVLTQSAPADANGVRAVTRYAYAQRYPWITNGSTFVQGASSIWVQTEMRTCRTSATVSGACSAGSSDEVVTAYDYGPNSGPNNLLLRGVAVTADGITLRTCYGYDARGNKIFETKPLAGLTVCS